MRKRIFQCLLFVAIFLVLNVMIGAFLEQPKKVLIKLKKYDPYWRWQEFYALPQRSLDLVFLGSSHSYRSFDPRFFNQALGLRSFNMGSSSQTPLTGYFVLREILENQKPKVLIYEIYWKSFEKDDEYSNATYNFENMRSGSNRMEFFKHAYRIEDMVNFILPAQRYKYNLYDSFRHLAGKEVHYEKGYTYEGYGYASSHERASRGLLVNGNPFKDYVFDRTRVAKRELNYLDQIIALCRKEGIRVVFVTAPLPPTTLGMMKNYGAIHEFFNDIAKRNGIPYFNYNVLDKERSMFTDEDFKDCDHLNVDGVQKLDTDLAEKFRALGIGQ